MSWAGAARATSGHAVAALGLLAELACTAGVSADSLSFAEVAHPSEVPGLEAGSKLSFVCARPFRAELLSRQPSAASAQ